jgi:hypothetical protein
MRIPSVSVSAFPTFRFSTRSTLQAPSPTLPAFAYGYLHFVTVQLSDRQFPRRFKPTVKNLPHRFSRSLTADRPDFTNISQPPSRRHFLHPNEKPPSPPQRPTVGQLANCPTVATIRRATIRRSTPVCLTAVSPSRGSAARPLTSGPCGLP